MNLSEKIKNAPIGWFIGVVLVGFIIGFSGGYAIVKISGNDLVQKDSYTLNSDLDKQYVKKEIYENLKTSKYQ